MAFNGAGPVNITAPRADVNFTYVTAFQLTGGAFTVDTSTTTAGATAGNIYLSATSMTTPTSTVSLKANGGGNGGNITFYPGTATIKLGTNNGDIAVSSNGGTTGNGGTINIDPSSGNITIDTANAINASSGPTSGTGGTVNLTANPNISVTGTVTGAAINVDGKGSGDGGQIHILANGTLNLGGAAGALSLSASNNGGTGSGGTIEIGYVTTLTSSGTISANAGTATGSNGHGGTINIHDNGTVSVGTTVLNASGQGTGAGGNITVSGANNIDFTGATITAKGGTTGAGGTFTTLHALTFDVHGIVSVDAGSSSPVNVQDGTVSLNGVPCGQWKLGSGNGNTSWLKTYWACANPTTPDALEQNASVGANNVGAIKSVFDTHGVQFYVFATPAKYNTFFAVSSAAVVDFGYTRVIGTPVYSSVFETNNSHTVTTDTVKEFAAHELGHAAAILEGDETGSQAYVTWAENDLLKLDYTTVGSGNSTSTRRAACSSNGTAPFDGVNAESDGNPICNSGVLAPRYRVGGVATGAPLINSKIAQIASGAFLWTSNDFVEMYAQAFAYESVSINLPVVAYFTADRLFGNSINLFACVPDWGDSRNRNVTPSNAACSAAVPGWYHTQVTTQ